MRAFFAVVPPRPIREAIEVVREPLRELAPEGRWVHPSLWHLTLKFLGSEVEDELIPAVTDLAGEIAARFESFEIAFKDTGLFPNAERPRVLWVGLSEGQEQLASIAQALDEGLDGLGFEAETRPYAAHLTIARFREPGQAGELAAQVGPTDEIARFRVDSFVLMRSVLRPRGPDYSVVGKLDLIPHEEPAVEAESEGEPPDASTESPDEE